MWFEKEYLSKAELGAIKATTLIVYGDHDYVTLEHGVDMHHAIENSQFCVLPDCSHEEVFLRKSYLSSKIAEDFFNGK